MQLFLHALHGDTRRRSVGGGVAALSFDEEFQRRRINRRREAGGAGGVDRRTDGRGGAHGAALMMVHAVRDLGGGIYHGVTGVVVEPYRRARVRVDLDPGAVRERNRLVAKHGPNTGTRRTCADWACS